MGGPNFVYDVFFWKIYSAFFFDKLLALLKFCTDPYAAPPLEYNLFSQIFSDFERYKLPLASALAFLFITNLSGT